ncbi:MAG TPA: hypothetical protein VFS00_16875, partial [Polyangiaceae bacterium]|nr:hypothetical protein [Polyangiaceae bacterium]
MTPPAARRPAGARAFGRGAAAAMLPAAFALAGAGCGGVEARAVAFRDPAPAAGQTDLYLGKVPARPYSEAGIVQALGTGASADEASVLRALREQGRRLGCDAVVRVSVARGQTA